MNTSTLAIRGWSQSLAFCILGTLVLLFASESRAATGWMDGKFSSTGYSCIIMAGSGTAAANAYAGYLTDPTTYTPKAGDVYYVHAVAANLMPCANLGVSPEITLPPNTVTAISATTPIRCFFRNFNTGVVNEVAGKDTANNHYNCPASVVSGVSGGQYSLGYGTVPPGWMFDVWLPVKSTKTLIGSASSTDFVRGTFSLVSDYATLSSSLIQADAWVTVYAGGTSGATPTVTYQPDATSSITSTTARNSAQINNHYTSGTVYFDLGPTTAYGDVASGALPATYDVSYMYVDWSGLLPGTTYHWRTRYVSNGQTYYGDDQTFTTLTTAQTTSADVSVTIVKQADPVAMPTAANSYAALTYAMMVYNNGPAAASSVVLTGKMPAGTQFVSVGSYSYATCTTNATDYTCTFNQAMASGDAKPIRITFSTSSTGDLSFNASVSTATADSNSANNTASVTTTVVKSDADLMITAGQATPANAKAVKGSTGVVMQQVRLTAGAGGAVTVSKLSIQASGTGTDNLDVSTVKLVKDINGNGVVDTGETEIASGKYSANDGTLDLALTSSLTINANTSVDVLVVYDMNSTISVAGMMIATSMLMLGMVGTMTRKGKMVAALIVFMLVIAGCSGSSGGGSSSASGTGSGSGSGTNTGTAADVTFETTVTGGTATGSKSSLLITGTPLKSATKTVTP